MIVTASVPVHPNLTLSDVDPVDASSDFSLFEALRETIYSEVATLISQNESRPHFLIELFHELQLLNTDYLRQRALFSLQVNKNTRRAQASTKQGRQIMSFHPLMKVVQLINNDKLASTRLQSTVGFAL